MFKEQYNDFKDKLQKEPLGATFDKGYDKLRAKVTDMVNTLSIVYI